MTRCVFECSTGSIGNGPQCGGCIVNAHGQIDVLDKSATVCDELAMEIHSPFTKEKESK